MIKEYYVIYSNKLNKWLKLGDTDDNLNYYGDEWVTSINNSTKYHDRELCELAMLTTDSHFEPIILKYCKVK